MHERLAYVYTEVGAANLMAFYEALTRRGDLPDGFPSYEAARTYHGSKRRVPPVEYLQRIVETFPRFDALWLLTGRGDRKRVFPPPAYKKEIADAFTDAAGRHVDNANSLSAAVHEAVQHTVRKARVLATSYVEVEPARIREIEIGFAKVLGGACAASARYLLAGTTDKKDERFVPFDAFAQRFIIAAEELVPFWADAQLTPAERKARREFKATLLGQSTER